MANAHIQQRLLTAAADDWKGGWGEGGSGRASRQLSAYHCNQEREGVAGRGGAASERKPGQAGIVEREKEHDDHT